MTKKLTSQTIKELSYTDFVGLINQWNVLPGSYTTLSKWVTYGHISPRSQILEVACTTGFSSREIANMTGCSGLGIDLSKASVEMAVQNQKIYAPKTKIKYKVANGYTFTPPGKYSHIIFGAALKFFPNPEGMLSRSIGWLNDGGYVLASPFYVTKPVPASLLQKAQKVFGITPTTEPYKEIMRMYRSLEIQFEERSDIIQETEEELNYYCNSTISRAAIALNLKDQAVIGAMRKRLYEIKKMSNNLRPYQKYAVLVLRYRKNIYPHRYVELF